jgi:hypothetical protein
MTYTEYKDIEKVNYGKWFLKYLEMLNPRVFSNSGSMYLSANETFSPQLMNILNRIIFDNSSDYINEFKNGFLGQDNIENYLIDVVKGKVYPIFVFTQKGIVDDEYIAVPIDNGGGSGIYKLPDNYTNIDEESFIEMMTFDENFITDNEIAPLTDVMNTTELNNYINNLDDIDSNNRKSPFTFDTWTPARLMKNLHNVSKSELTGYKIDKSFSSLWTVLMLGVTESIGSNNDLPEHISLMDLGMVSLGSSNVTFIEWFSFESLGYKNLVASSLLGQNVDIDGFTNDKKPLQFNHVLYFGSLENPDEGGAIFVQGGELKFTGFYSFSEMATLKGDKGGFVFPRNPNIVLTSETRQSYFERLRVKFRGSITNDDKMMFPKCIADIDTVTSSTNTIDKVSTMKPLVKIENSNVCSIEQKTVLCVLGYTMMKEGIWDNKSFGNLPNEKICSNDEKGTESGVILTQKDYNEIPTFDNSITEPFVETSSIKDITGKPTVVIIDFLTVGTKYYIVLKDIYSNSILQLELTSNLNEKMSNEITVSEIFSKIITTNNYQDLIVRSEFSVGLDKNNVDNNKKVFYEAYRDVVLDCVKVQNNTTFTEETLGCITGDFPDVNITSKIQLLDLGSISTFLTIGGANMTTDDQTDYLKANKKTYLSNYGDDLFSGNIMSFNVARNIPDKVVDFVRNHTTLSGYLFKVIDGFFFSGTSLVLIIKTNECDIYQLIIQNANDKSFTNTNTSIKSVINSENLYPKGVSESDTYKTSRFSKYKASVSEVFSKCGSTGYVSSLNMDDIADPVMIGDNLYNVSSLKFDENGNRVKIVGDENNRLAIPVSNQDGIASLLGTMETVVIDGVVLQGEVVEIVTEDIATVDINQINSTIAEITGNNELVLENDNTTNPTTTSTYQTLADNMVEKIKDNTTTELNKLNGEKDKLNKKIKDLESMKIGEKSLLSLSSDTKTITDPETLASVKIKISELGVYYGLYYELLKKINILEKMANYSVTTNTNSTAIYTDILEKIGEELVNRQTLIDNPDFVNSILKMKNLSC